MPELTTTTETFRIPGLDCPDELALIQKGLRNRGGIGSLLPNYVDRTLRVEFDAEQLDAAQVAEAIRRIGFEVEASGERVASGQDVGVTRLRVSTKLGGGLLLAATVVWLWGDAHWASALAGALAAASAVASGVPVARAAWRAVRLLALDMNALMTIAAIGAVAIGEFFEAATAMFLFAISLWLESLSMGRARRAVRSLVELEPSVAHRIMADRRLETPPTSPLDVPTTGQVEDVDPAELVVGDRVLARPGERIAVDGVVTAGSSAVNEAPITGESIPVEKSPGDAVFAGTLNGEGSLEIEAGRTAHESTLAHIARLVHEAQASRSPTERFVDRFARWYTPTVIVLAVLLAFLPPLLTRWGVGWATIAPEETSWFYRGLVLLVIACPCALVISTPITIVCGLYRAARRGMLVKGGEHLEGAGRIDCLAIDKTGTLTTGVATVVEVEPAPGHTVEEVLQIAASLEHHSEHPLAAAIVAAADQRGIATKSVADFAALRGFGVEGTIAGKHCFVGSPRLVQEKNIASAMHDERAETAAMVATDNALVGTIWLADPPREDAAEAIAQLRALGVEPIWLVSGDREVVARKIAAQVGIGEVFADLLPQDKVRRIEELAAERPNLAMVGDGVNDAPALAAARLGVALGRQASDTVLETADVVVMAPQLVRLPELIQLGRRCRRLLGQNIALALAAKGLVLVLAALGYATMWMAVAADVGASLVVIANGMRMMRGGKEFRVRSS